MMAFDDGARARILEHSAELVTADVGVIPLFHYQNIWASRRGLVGGADDQRPHRRPDGHATLMPALTATRR